MRIRIALVVAAGLWQMGLDRPDCIVPTHPPTHPTMTAALRLHTPDAAVLPSLMEVFKTHIRPELDVRDQEKTAKSYGTAIRKFTAFLQLGTITISNRATGEPEPFFSDAVLLAWQKHELDSGIKASSINTHAKYLLAVLRRMGPREKGNPKGLGMINTVPHLSALPVPRPKVRVVDLQTLDAVYTYGCPDMTWPEPVHGISTVRLWRAWLVASYNLAMRTRDLLGMRWEAIHWEPQSLDPESPNESPHGWVEWIPAKTRNKKPEPHVLPLHRALRAHLEAIRHEGEFVFGRQFAKVSNRKLYGQEGRPGEWYRLLDLASTHRPVPRFEIRTIRRTANSQYNRIDRKLGAHVLGHAPRGVNDLFYQQWEADAVALMSRLPQPQSFDSAPRDSPRQVLMF